MKKIISIIAVLLIAVIITVFFVLKSTPPKNDHSANVKPATEAIAQVNQNPTIETKWQWQKVKKQMQKDEIESEDEQSLPFTPQSVHDALYAVKIDDNGDIILDANALISLDEALERIYNQLDSDSIIKLQDLIKNALPGRIGEQTAKIVSDYNGFLKAKEQFSLLHENTVYVDGAESIATVERDQSLYGELQALREVHLGEQVTESLFREHDANAEFMFDSMKLALDDSLTPEVREQRRQEIEERLRAVVPMEEAAEAQALGDTPSE